MQSIFDLEFIRQFNNLLILALGALAIIFILRGVFKVAWKVIKIIFVLLGLLLLFGWLLGYVRNASIENVTEEVTLAHRKMLPVDFPQTCHFLVN